MSLDRGEDWDRDCSRCGAKLQPDEVHYYGHTCNECEGKWLNAVETWRNSESGEPPPA